ncbi:MAG: GNAT family N-acetyltransferase [Alphaproteobacteria bacterium]|jgi:L-ornithine Nalpha-acyltransferase|nr:GNAT family N-acetyltransferase [Alphaproteobacteria bacterium]MBT5389529.1 GNAT family N-acetyltransferase [Alphaproteobacteria bacterium]MBT5540827.1 GNAT family N-acetyltransferase [Alphaproteobacteria bacterium]MBT5653890.1 GNAT family N-acetyltransferase [Alphaproteobacteria bacterium]
MVSPLPTEQAVNQDSWPQLSLGDLEVRLAKTPEDIKAVQNLRFQVFFEEMKAKPSPEAVEKQRDIDAFDEFCDHLMVVDHQQNAKVVGTYRLIRRHMVKNQAEFYSASEYDISKILNYPGEILELGRSCVAKDCRTRPTMQLLWRGLATYISRHNVAILFGCASFPGTSVEKLDIPLTYLYQNHLAPEDLRPKALPDLYNDMNLLPSKEIHLKEILTSLPPLIKGYLRAGVYVGDGAVIDHEFNTTDVCIVVKTEHITDRYNRHYL